ncbi:uncharacterized protein [Epargyreus clarus]|uniref:uncharacterized protein n=1 Tax=Epargyreus clarus TaxID=520877 RepID=UPI003C2E7356
MADAALVRREARRKRILENSHNRLQLISSVTNDDCCKESPVKSVKTSIPEQNNEVPATTFETTPIGDIVNNGVINRPVTYEPLSDNLEDIFFGEQEITNDSAAFVCPKPEPSETSLLEKLTAHKYDLVVLSLLIQLLHTSIMPLDNTYFFLPLILYTITKIVFLPKQETSKYANILMLLNGMNPQTSPHTVKLMSMLHGLIIIAQDACIYLFTTICVQSLCIMMNNFIS